MAKQLGIRAAAMAALLAASAASGIAFAVYENEPNNSITSPQRLVIVSSEGTEVTGALGALSLASPVVNDVDFYTFEGRAGDVVSIDIDGGMKAAGSTVRSVDTILALFRPDLAILSQKDDVSPADPGSTSTRDARLDNIRLPVTGTYTVGVSSFPRFFLDGGALKSTALNANSNGSYTLLISGVTPPVQQINIEIKPGSGELAPVNPKSRGNIPVALLSSAEFDALAVNQKSITFGATGSEASLLRCNKDGTDVDGDGRPDLVCHFENQKAEFDASDTEGIVKGETAAGRLFEGRGFLKVVPVKRED